MLAFHFPMNVLYMYVYRHWTGRDPKGLADIKSIRVLKGFALFPPPSSKSRGGEGMFLRICIEPLSLSTCSIYIPVTQSCKWGDL